MDEKFIEVNPAEAVFFEDYPMTKIYAQVNITNTSTGKIVFRVIFSQTNNKHINLKIT